MIMKKIFMTIFCVVTAIAAIMAIRYVAAISFTNTINPEIVTEERLAEAKGFILRDERVFNAQGGGTVYSNLSEGGRVSKDGYIATVYYGNVSADKLKELNNIDKKIAAAIDRENKKTYREYDDTSVEGEIASLELRIIEAAAENDISKIADYKSQINGIRAGETAADESEQLTAQRQSAEAQMGVSKSDMFTDMTGVFTTYMDGFENILNPSLLDQYTVDFIDGLQTPEKRESTLGKVVAAGDPVCKVVNNHVWYAVVTAEAKDIASCKAGDTVTLRFKNMAGAETTGTIESISEPDASGRSLAVIKSYAYFEGAFAYREADVDLVFESYTGYKVPTYAVRTAEGKYSVIGEIGKKRYTCDCNVLYSDADEGFAIVQSTEDAVNKLSQMERIVIGE